MGISTNHWAIRKHLGRWIDVGFENMGDFQPLKLVFKYLLKSPKNDGIWTIRVV